MRNGALEDEYCTALQALQRAGSAASPQDASKPQKRKYLCGRCGVPKKGHVCPKALKSKKRTGSAARSVKRARK